MGRIAKSQQQARAKARQRRIALDHDRPSATNASRPRRGKYSWPWPSAPTRKARSGRRRSALATHFSGSSPRASRPTASLSSVTCQSVKLTGYVGQPKRRRTPAAMSTRAARRNPGLQTSGWQPVLPCPDDPKGAQLSSHRSNRQPPRRRDDKSTCCPQAVRAMHIPPPLGFFIHRHLTNVDMRRRPDVH